MKALIVLGGDAPGKVLLESCAAQADLVIAADRGIEAFAGCDVLPDLLLGDMDSVNPDVLSQFERIAPERRLNCIKDDTDAEAALNVAIERGATEITMLGALGGRLDHAMANVMLLVQAAQKGAKAYLLDETVCIERVCGKTVLRGVKGNTVSLLPLGCAEGVTLTGFYYPLSEKTICSDCSLGISNVVTEDEAVASVRQGDVILFHYYTGRT